MSTGVFVAVALALAVGLATAASPFASSSPDGLEAVAAQKQFAGRGELHPVQERAPIADYAFPGIENERVATGLAGFVGTLAAFGLGYGAARLLRRRAGPPPAAPAAGGPVP
ncbi:MAG: PDGLE domain-containing protein [Solirubrobacterales bacterium]